MFTITVDGTAGLAAPVAQGHPTAIVSMGDSYISGEGGRWFGNSNNPMGSHDGTDRAYRGKDTYDVGAIYGGSADNGCDRSDVAEILSNDIPVDRKFNIACSGAETVHLLRSQSGGKYFKGEMPQADRLAEIAKDHEVTLIALSVGGNDLGFGTHIADCITRYLSSTSANPSYCAGRAQDAVNAGLPALVARIGIVIDDIRSVMTASGQAPHTYDIVLQSYPAVLPYAADIRYPQDGVTRTAIGGCPVWNQDLNWYRELGISQMTTALRDVAEVKKVSFLDLSELLQGREVCSRHSKLVDLFNPANPETSEWARFITTGAVQGHVRESMHLNAYGQQATGRCLELAYQRGPGNHSCLNIAGEGPRNVYLMGNGDR
ncbi:MAG: hypothetical protein H0T78_10125 [Longispora sp.]|nr:hypothetical protein [Longispora sp. (in: high G+C Gram-positive bacteria)]